MIFGRAVVASIAAPITVVAALIGVAAGIAAARTPPGDAAGAAKVALGRRLFYDADLSVDGTMSCASCHEQRRGFADGNRTRPGVHGDPGRRNVPGLANVGRFDPLTWADPGLHGLEAQMLVPLLGDNPVEMGMKGTEAEVERRFGRDACYRAMFAAAFPADGRIDLPHAAKAIAAFERTMVSDGAAYDRRRVGRASADFPAIALRGEALFAARCAGCHAGPDFSDGGFHSIEPPAGRDPGLAEKTGRAEDRGRFRTPPLRNLALTAPYLHDGSAPTIPDAIRRHAGPPPSDEEMSALVAFLVRLTDAGFVNDRRLARPDTACGKPL